MPRPLAPGKLPNPVLDLFIGRFVPRDESLLIAPAVGEDVAAVSFGSEEVLVFKADPVTFATEAIGHYAVVVNVNDIVTCGATPRWLLTTLLFPPGSTEEEIGRVMQDLRDLCRQNSLILCGGHTEITDAVTRPVVSAQVAGTVPRTRLIEKRNAREGDRVLLTKRIAIEGTSIIAREFGVKLRMLGMEPGAIERCRRLLEDPGISVRQEAEIAAASGSVSAMHDITEGGLSTALEELSIACRHRIRIRADRIPILTETAQICRLLNAAPLGLIGSGSLLICCRAEAAEGLGQAIRKAGIEAELIGEVLDEGAGIEAIDATGASVPWPRFDVDEIARLSMSLR